MPLSMKISTALLFGLCVLVTVDSMTTSKSLTRAADAAAATELSNATEQLTTTPVTQQLRTTWTPDPKLAEVSTPSSRGVGTDQVTSRKSGLYLSTTLRTSGATSNAQRLFTESVSRPETTRAQLSNKTTDATHKPSPTSLVADLSSLQPTSIAHTDATSVVRSTSEGSTEGTSFSTQNLTNSTPPGAATTASATSASPVPFFSMTKASTKTSLSPTRIYKNSLLLSTTTGSTSSSSPSTRWIPQTSTKSFTTSSITTTPPSNKCQTTTSSSVKTCSTRGLVNKCLIAVGALAVLATIFMVSTIVLCAKLSARKQKPRRRKESTEMMCISSLLPERHHNYARQRNPVTNGVLVFPAGADSDEDGGDNLTLSSFLPESV
ncbi:P-selectin glycoprotein ligand 1 [Oryzias melastigma]|uniref:P-selectin glycoprotein ligand 1 n=1 Tax=Oryzias melastigma TaxID=30732 RepID=A0A834FFQ5_ORYME|nr:P-selectin glycoprotein ligand 1 [Oryzias melastigma]